MTNKSRLLLGLLMATPGLAHALGLGDIRLGSALNQPLAAEIELVGATQEELAQVRAGVASPEAFSRYGLDRPQFLSGLSFRVARDAAGRNVLELRSAQPITEPFVTLLVEVTWPRGRLIREYTVLLDP
ncbi:MAG: FimV family protein, partial [Pseudomonadota bacterium]